MQTRTTGAISTKPTGNAQGGHWFYSLTTGRMLDRKHWTALPMPTEVITRMNVLAKNGHVGMHFTNMRNEEYVADDEDDTSESDDDSDYTDDSSTDGDDDDFDNFIAGVNSNNLPTPDPIVADMIADNENNQEDADEISDHEDNDDDPDDNEDNDDQDEDQDDGDDNDVVITPDLKKLTDYTGTLSP